MNMTNANRCDFLKLTTNALFSLAGLLGLGGIVRFLGFQPDPGPPTEFDLGLESDYPEGSPVMRLDIPAIIKRTENGIIALSLVCTHLGCTIEQDEDSEGFTCPCHGSRYSLEGALLEGPATKNLAPYRVEAQADGSLRLYTK